MANVSRGWVVCTAVVLALAAAGTRLASATSLPVKTKAPPSASDSAKSKAPRPEYLRIQVSPTCNVYVELKQDEARVATTPAGLAAAKVVRAAKLKKPAAGSSSAHTFAEIVLPVKTDQLPPHYLDARVRFQVTPRTQEEGDEERASCVDADLGLARKDDQGVVWTYWVSEHLHPTKAPVDAPVMNVPKLIKPTLDVTAEAQGSHKVGIGIATKAGESELSDISRDGKRVLVQVRLLDAKGKAVVSETGGISKYGFG